MYSVFRNLRLFGEFDVKLEDFLPSAEPEARVPLPEQPMPNAQIIQPQQQAMATQTGLTPTELALLSPAEQQMRLKQRGLA